MTVVRDASHGEEALRRYFSKELRWGWGYEARAVYGLLREAAQTCRGGVVLDAGAGHQRYRPFFDDALYVTQEHPAGIEFKGMENLPYDLIGPIDERIPLVDSSVDGILSTSVLEHLASPGAFIAEAHRVLKPGGKLFINVPFCYPEHEVPYDFNRPTRYALKRWFEAAGFDDYSIRPSTSGTAATTELLWMVVRPDRDHVMKGIRSRSARMLYALACKATFAATFVFAAFLRRLFDRGGYEENTFPVGWIAIAVKAGIHEKAVDRPDRQEFLRRYAG
jgi:SAM-dependent methyltransferase